jgi:glycosyltransferase involved in cell wall biosynthesis
MDERYRIVFAADVSLRNRRSGSEEVLAQQVLGLAHRGLGVCAITRENGGSSEIVVRNIAGVIEAMFSANTGSPVFFLRTLLSKPPRIFDQLRQGGDFGVVVSHQPFTCFSLLLNQRLNYLPMLYIFHSPSHEDYQLSKLSRRYALRFAHTIGRRFIENYCLNRSHRVVVLSRYMKKKLQAIHGISDDRICINPGGADLDRFKPKGDRRLLKQTIGFREDKLHFLTVRNLEPRMGLDNLVRAVALLKAHRVELHLIIGGQGPERERIENLSSKWKLRGEITFSGYIPDDNLADYYRAADFCIVPTRELEGFGLATVEALACGTPVLGTPVGGTQEILSGLEPGLLFSDTSPEAIANGIETAIQRFWYNQAAYNELRARCRRHAVRHYSWDRHVDQLKSVIDELTGADLKKERGTYLRLR